MASINRSLLITLISIYLSATTIATEIHDILPEYGLPKGILPNAVESFYISPTDGTFTIELTGPCQVTFGFQKISYKKSIKGKLSYGSVSDISGILEKEFLLWMSVSRIDMNGGSDTLLLNVLGKVKMFPVTMFQDVPECENNAYAHGSYSQSI